MAEPGLARLMQRVHHFAENIELQLVMRRVADAHRLRVGVARQPRHFPFGQPPLAANAVHDLNLARTAGRRAQEPVAPHLRLVVVAAVHQRQQRQRRVAQPAVAVVPVAHAANTFRQRRGRRRHHAAGRRIGQRFQRNKRTHHRFVIRSGNLVAATPFEPIFFGRDQLRRDIDRLRNVLVRERVRQAEALQSRRPKSKNRRWS